MAASIEEIRRILAEVRPELMKKPNVRATGIGYKRVNNTSTEQLAIICSVEVKKNEDSLSADDMIPKQIQDIPTDVKPTGMFRSFQDPTKRYRPAPGGVSIAHVNVTAGTLGCLVQKNGVLYILSNNHVLANSNEASSSDPILQPGPHDGGQLSEDKIAELSDFVPIIFESDNGNGDGNDDCPTAGLVISFSNALASMTGSNVRLHQYRIDAEASASENKVDCAIAEPDTPDDVKNEILQIGTIAGLQEATLNMEVQKSGRTTGLTEGVIEQVDVTARVNYGSNKVAVFTDQIMAGSMSQGGDSGSVVLDKENNLVGLLFAGSDTTTLINRIQDVFDALEVSLP